MEPEQLPAARLSFPAFGSLVVLGGLTVFAPLIEGGTTHLPVLLIRFILVGAVTAWLLRSMRTGRITVQQTRVFSAMVVFVGWAAVSVVRSSYLAPSIQWLISLCSYAVCLFLVVHLVLSVREVRRLVTVLLGMGVFEAALGLYQFMWGGKARPTGTFFNANFFASYEMAVFAVAFGLLCYRRPTEGVRWETPLLWLTAGAVVVAFILAQSRGALLAFVVAVACVGLYRFGKPFLAVIVLCLIVGAIVQNPLQQRMLTVGAQDPYAYTRLAIWRNSLERISDRPWGVGLGLYKYTSFLYRFPVDNAIARYGKRAESAHNEYLQMAVELGALGLVLFLVGVSLLGWETRETLCLPLEPWERGLAIGLTGGIIGFLVHGAVDSVLHEPALVLLMTLFAGLILVLRQLRGASGASTWVLPFPYHPARMALIGVLALVAALLVIRPFAAWHVYDGGKEEHATGRVDQALQWYQWAARIDPGMSAYHDAVASAEIELYRQTGDLRRLVDAERAFRVALELNPLDARLANHRGGLLILLAERAPTGE